MPACPECGQVFDSVYSVQQHRRNGGCAQAGFNVSYNSAQPSYYPDNSQQLSPMQDRHYPASPSSPGGGYPGGMSGYPLPSNGPVVMAHSVYLAPQDAYARQGLDPASNSTANSPTSYRREYEDSGQRNGFPLSPEMQQQQRGELDIAHLLKEVRAVREVVEHMKHRPNSRERRQISSTPPPPSPPAPPSRGSKYARSAGARSYTPRDASSKGPSSTTRRPPPLPSTPPAHRPYRSDSSSSTDEEYNERDRRRSRESRDDRRDRHPRRSTYNSGRTEEEEERGEDRRWQEEEKPRRHDNRNERSYGDDEDYDDEYDNGGGRRRESRPRDREQKRNSSLAPVPRRSLAMPTVQPPFPTVSSLAAGVHRMRLASMEGIQLDLPLDEIDVSVQVYYLGKDDREYFLEPSVERRFARRPAPLTRLAGSQMLFTVAPVEFVVHKAQEMIVLVLELKYRRQLLCSATIFSKRCGAFVEGMRDTTTSLMAAIYDPSAMILDALVTGEIEADERDYLDQAKDLLEGTVPAEKSRASVVTSAVLAPPLPPNEPAALPPPAAEPAAPLPQVAEPAAPPEPEVEKEKDPVESSSNAAEDTLPKKQITNRRVDRASSPVPGDQHPLALPPTMQNDVRSSDYTEPRKPSSIVAHAGTARTPTVADALAPPASREGTTQSDPNRWKVAPRLPGGVPPSGGDGAGQNKFLPAPLPELHSSQPRRTAPSGHQPWTPGRRPQSPSPAVREGVKTPLMIPASAEDFMAAPATNAPRLLDPRPAPRTPPAHTTPSAMYAHHPVEAQETPRKQLEALLQPPAPTPAEPEELMPKSYLPGLPPLAKPPNGQPWLPGMPTCEGPFIEPTAAPHTMQLQPGNGAAMPYALPPPPGVTLEQWQEMMAAHLAGMQAPSVMAQPPLAPASESVPAPAVDVNISVAVIASPSPSSSSSESPSTMNEAKPTGDRLVEVTAVTTTFPTGNASNSEPSVTARQPVAAFASPHASPPETPPKSPSGARRPVVSIVEGPPAKGKSKKGGGLDASATARPAADPALDLAVNRSPPKRSAPPRSTVPPQHPPNWRPTSPKPSSATRPPSAVQPAPSAPTPAEIPTPTRPTSPPHAQTPPRSASQPARCSSVAGKPDQSFMSIMGDNFSGKVPHEDEGLVDQARLRNFTDKLGNLAVPPSYKMDPKNAPAVNLDKFDIATVPPANPCVLYGLAKASDLNPVSRKHAGKASKGKSVDLYLDGLTGLPLDAVCTRLLVYVTDGIDSATGEPINPLRNPRVFMHTPDYMIYQNLNSSSLEPRFVGKFSPDVGDNTCAVVIAEFITTQQGETNVFGHCCLPINKKFYAGNFLCRMKAGDPRRTQERMVGDVRPADRIVDEQRRETEKYTQRQLEASVDAQALRNLMPNPPRRRAECMPMAYLIWRLDSSDIKTPFFEMPQQLPVSHAELAVFEARRTLKESTPSDMGLKTVQGADNVFVDTVQTSSDAVGRLVPFSPERGVFVKVEGLRGMGDDAAMYVVVLYMPKAPRGKRVCYTVMPDWMSDVGAPRYKDAPFVFNQIKYDQTNTVLFMLLKITDLETPEPDPVAVQPLGWTMNKVFLDTPNTLRQGRFALPWVNGPLPVSVVNDLTTKKVDSVYMRLMKSGGISFVEPPCTMMISQGDTACVTTLVDESPGRHQPRQLLIPANKKKDFPTATCEGMVGCTLRRAHEACFGGGDPRAILQRINIGVQDYLKKTMPSFEEL